MIRLSGLELRYNRVQKDSNEFKIEFDEINNVGLIWLSVLDGENVIESFSVDIIFNSVENELKEHGYTLLELE